MPISSLPRKPSEAVTTTTPATAAAASSSPSASSPSSSALHPCLRIFGKCNFGSKCRFASLPANCCLSFLKGNCNSKKCKYPHVSSIAVANSTTTTTTKKTVPVPSTKDDNHDVEENEINDLMMILCPDDNDDNDDTANQARQVRVQVQQPKNTTKVKQHQNDMQDLKNRHKLAQKALALKHEANLKIEKEKNAKLEQELKNTNDKLSHLQKTSRLFQEQLPDLILSLTKSAQASSSSSTPSDEKSIAEEIKALSEKIENQILSSRRQPLLEKVFELASAEFKAQKTQYLRGYSDLVPNDCLFSGHSEVAEKFFKACPDTIFAHELFTATTTTNERGEKKESKLELNTERFAISFHGTRGLVPAFAIEHGGLDPARRAGQALGPGEYSSPYINTASGYSAGTILAMLIYKPREEDAKHKSSNKCNGVKKFGPVNLHNDSVYVVENPSDKSCTYMLPLGTSFYFEQLKNETFKRSCDCKEKMDKNNNKDNKDIENNNHNNHYGKKFFFKEKNEKKSEYQQMGEESCRVLLKALFEEKPKEQTKKNKKQKKNKNNNTNNHNNNGYPTCYVFTKEGEVCSVDLNTFEMKHMKSGKVFSLGVWTPRE